MLSSFTPGQSNSQPQSDFGLHVLARPLGGGGLLYDPSYGVVRGINVLQNGIELVPGMDDAVSAYFKVANNPNEYGIKFNGIIGIPNDFMFVTNNFPEAFQTY